MKANPITVEVIRSALTTIANEMATVLRKTSYNMMIHEVRDYCVGLLDLDGNILAQNFGALPIFLADLGPAILDGVKKYGQDGFEPGDVLIMNHPYVCGQHLNNVVIYTPIFFQNKLVAFPGVRAHWVDVGGSRLGFGFSGTKEIFEEGLQFRSLKLYRAGTEDRDLFQIIGDNVRFPESVLGDLRAQISACRIGERRLSELLNRYGPEVFWQAVKTIWDQSELLSRKEILKIPSGVYEAAAQFDSDGIELDRRVPLRVKVEVSGDEMTIDFSGMSDQVQGAINSGISGAIAAARVAFKSLVSPISPIDEGCFRPLHVIIPPGKLLSAESPAAVGNWSRTLPTVVDLILTALSAAIPDQIPAAHMGYLGAYAFHGIDPRTKKRFLCQGVLGGGWGGRPHEDGENATVSVCQGDVQSTPVELQELKHPVLIECERLREGSGGRGKYRGGLGLEFKLRLLCDGFANINVERTHTPPWGLFGGEDAEPGETLVQQNDNDPGTRVKKKPNYPVKQGGVVTFLTPGGGGYAGQAARRRRRTGFGRRHRGD
jgi:N-methylhydantoinase B